jgi:hypothetical protein
MTIVASFTVPAGYSTGGLGSLSIAEYGGPPTTRLVTISTQPCDFRNLTQLDPGGVTAPLAAANGSILLMPWSTADYGVATLKPGTTYYVNIQNKSYRNGATTCNPGASCDAIVTLSLP